MAIPLLALEHIKIGLVSVQKGNSMKSYFFIFNIILVTFFLVGDVVQSQTHDRHLIVFGGISIPTGDFSSSSGMHANYAESGIALGVEFTSALSKNLHIGLSGTFLLHNYDTGAQQNFMQDTLPMFKVYAEDYLSTSLMGMVGYNTDISSAFMLYGRGEIGAFIFRQPEIREDNITRSGSGRRTKSATVALSPGYGFQVGIVVSENFDIGFRYFFSPLNFNVGVHEAHGTTQTAAYTENIKHSVSTVQIVVGYVIGL